MKKKELGVYRLLTIIVVLSISIWFINKHKENIYTTSTHIDIPATPAESISHLPLENIYSHIHPLLISHDINLLIKTINQFNHDIITNLIEKLMNDASHTLSSEEKAKIIFEAVSHCHTKKNTQYTLLNFLLSTPPSICNLSSALITLIRNKHTNILPIFTQWAKKLKRDSKYCSLWPSLINHTFTIAIKENDYFVVETLLSKKIKVSEAKASQLLLYVIEHNKNSAFIPLLVKYAHADVNCAIQGKIPLIEAVEQNNIEHVHALLEAGAVVDRIVDKKKGTALHIAMLHKYTHAEKLLREYGA